MRPDRAERGSRTGGWRVLAGVAALGTVLLNRGPIVDADLFWHTLAGQYTLDGRGFPQPDPWSYTLPGHPWHTSAWLSEAVLAAIYDASGLAGFVVLRLLLLLALLVLLFRLLVRDSGWAGPVVFSIVALPLAGYVQERPQTASLLLCCWLAARCRNVLLEDRLPSRWRTVAMTYAWALLHGLFVLVPTCLVLLAVGQLLDKGRAGRAAARELVVTAVLALAVCAATPVGPRLLLAPVTIGSAARGTIAEWAPTSLLVFSSWAFAGTAAVVVIAWARGRGAPRSHLLWFLAFLAFGFLAFRNAAPAAILLAPLAVAALEATWQTSSTLTLPRVPVAALAAVSALAALLSYASAPLLSKGDPQRIAARLAGQDGTLRILNDYNVSGYLLREAWPHIRVDVDGRAERYGAAALSRYSDAVNGGTSWQRYVDELNPDAAVLRKETPLTQLLIGVRHWQVVMRDGDWVLLVPPGTTLS